MQKLLAWVSKPLQIFIFPTEICVQILSASIFRSDWSRSQVLQCRRPIGVITGSHRLFTVSVLEFKAVPTTGNAAFSMRSNLCRESFIGRIFAVHLIFWRTAKNLCLASYFLTHGKESLPCVLISGARQRFFFLSPLLHKRPLIFAVRFNFGARQRFFPSLFQ
jgi:hypothetical protein